jgi:lipopolysaccharide transport system ATP-binding protein
MTEPVIIVDKVSKRYRKYHAPRTLRAWLRDKVSGHAESNELWALRNVSCEVRPGKMVGLLGRNGAGKSTLLRLIGGVGRPDSGGIRTKGTIRALLDLGSGMNPDLTGKENTFLMGVVGGLTRKQVRQRLEAIVEFAGLKEFIDSPFRTYSSGMQLRLAFAIAVHTEPQILLVDEVLAVGDLAFQRKCLDAIRQIKAQGCAILLVTHDIQAVKELCDEAFWLRGGESVAYGLTESIVGQYVGEMLAETLRRTEISKDRPDTTVHEKLQMGVNRFGSREMEIRGVRLLNHLGGELTEVESGEAITIEITYYAPKLIESPIFSAGICVDESQMIIDINTDSKESALPSLEGHGKVSLKIERLDLRAQRYQVSVGVYHAAWSHAYDYHTQAYGFDVRTGVRQAGLLHVPHRWTLAAGEK